MFKNKTEEIFYNVLCRCLPGSIDVRDIVCRALHTEIPLDVLSEICEENEIKLNNGATFMDALKVAILNKTENNDE